MLSMEMKMKVLAIAASLACLLGATNLAFAQSADYLSQNRAVARAHYGASRNGVAANGRCRGISYGTGARTCGTATGGPVGGITGRN